MLSTARGIVSLLFVAYLCFLEEAQASFMMAHPQNLFCDADYVFKFKAMAMPVGSSSRRNKRGLAGYGRRRWNTKTQMVEVERIYKGEKMMMPMIKLVKATHTPVDTFSAATKIEASIQLGMNQKEFKKNEKCVFFGKMIRHGKNNTMLPSSAQKMMSNMGNTIYESSITRIMKRGLRKKYNKGCVQGCRVKIVYRPTKLSTEDRLKFCDWNINEYRPPRIDCCKTTQFCHRGKDGYCQWKVTKDYKKCVKDNRMP